MTTCIYPYGMANALQQKVKPLGPLADIIGTKAQTRPQIMKSIWKYIKKNGIQGESGTGKKETVNGKKYPLGQVIFSGEDSKMKAFAGGKSKITMFDSAKLVAKNVAGTH